MKVCIVGAGWYGCHLGLILKNLGINVDIFDREAHALSCASGNNQFRLHKGFHYARDYETRLQSRDGYGRFIERYPHLTRVVENNLYAVPERDSLLDFETYSIIMATSGITFERIDPKSLPWLSNVAGLMRTDERVIETEKSRRFFETKLADCLRFETEVAPEDIRLHETHVEFRGKQYDYLIDATWGHMSKISMDVFYEPTLLLYYRSPENFNAAITLVDGPLCSLYPTEEPGRFTLSSVIHTPLAHCETAQEARHYLHHVDTRTIERKRELMEAEFSKYFPDFKAQFSYDGPQLSIKTKPVGTNDNRACYVFQNGPVFRVMSGKIDTIFIAAERIVSGITSRFGEEYNF
ncbi:FAD-dependent oxidoreductase [Celeribacter neptunius]|uniref:FAD dependent oxidoreductase n=1 Tax=Celeribacter neptunius TaxID=588602 RepID=A0A1I3YCJ9_9RHOB|nr:FAD-dependent oxidoreductase [Celeribacter neptunius]SFK29542.1 hypothetical protein SAMN04487991_4316 [Celeribacter neptunius]